MQSIIREEIAALSTDGRVEDLRMHGRGGA